MELLGVPLSTDSRADLLAEVSAYLSEPKFHRIATVNPEFLVLSEKDQAFKASLLAADLRIADGFGIILVGFFRGRKLVRIPGADLVYDILALAEKDGPNVFLAIKKDGLSSYEEIRQALLKKYPSLNIGGLEIAVSDLKNYQLPATSYQLVLCNFGAPEQEIFLESLRSNPGNIRLAIGVGGSFDYLTGKLKRAPKILRLLGLEWLWRLILQPKRWRRIWSAVVVFPLKVLLQK